MYSEHLISLTHLDKLLYHQYPLEHDEDKVMIERPNFFTSQEDISAKTEFFPKGGEADRRLSYFAQSLCVGIFFLSVMPCRMTTAN